MGSCKDISFNPLQYIDSNLEIGIYNETTEEYERKNIYAWEELTGQNIISKRRRYRSKKIKEIVPSLLVLRDDKDIYIPKLFVYPLKCDTQIFYFNLIEFIRQLLVISCKSRESGNKYDNYAFIYNPISQLPFTSDEILKLKDIFINKYTKWKEGITSHNFYINANRLFYLSLLVNLLIGKQYTNIKDFINYISTPVYTLSSLYKTIHLIKNRPKNNTIIIESVGAILYNLYLYNKSILISDTKIEWDFNSLPKNIVSLLGIYSILYLFPNILPVNISKKTKSFMEDLSSSIASPKTFTHNFFDKFKKIYNNKTLNNIILSGQNIIALQVLQLNNQEETTWTPELNKMILITDKMRREFFPLTLSSLEDRNLNICPNIIDNAKKKYKLLKLILRTFPIKKDD